MQQRARLAAYMKNFRKLGGSGVVRWWLVSFRQNETLKAGFEYLKKKLARNKILDIIGLILLKVRLLK